MLHCTLHGKAVRREVCYNFMYRRPETPTQLLMHYFVARELFIAFFGRHGGDSVILHCVGWLELLRHSLSRNFFWYQNLLWPEAGEFR